MSPEQLLKHFEQIAEAPDAVPRLRRFILDLAMRGKLVEQDFKDESAAELLKRIEKKKEQLIKQGRIRKQSQLPSVDSEEIPFTIPDKWEWVRFGRIVDFAAGRTPTRNDLTYWNTGDFHWVSIADLKDGGVVVATKETISDKAKNYVFRSEPSPIGTLMMSFKLTIGKISRLGIPAFHNEAIISIHPHIPEMDSYLFLFLPRFSQQGETKDAIKGATLNRDSINNILIPIPPLAEQYRIVAKVDELMALCDELEAAQTKRESRRDRLVAATLHGLNNGDTGQEHNAKFTFKESARFYFNHLPRLTTRPEHIQQLRQTILNLAVRGKLVSQDPKDEPIHTTLRRIIDQRAKLIRTKKARHKKIDDCANLAKRDDLPESWEVERLGNLVDPENTISYGVLVPGNDVEDGIPFVRAQDLSLSSHPDRPNKTISPDIEKPYTRTRLRGGEILLCVVGSIGKLGVVPSSWAGANIARAVARIMPVHDISRDYLLVVLRSQLVQTYFLEATRTLAQPTLNIGLIEHTPIPLPPLAEQHRIVAKVDELMALCDELEKRLTTTSATRRQLLEATLHDALSA